MGKRVAAGSLWLWAIFCFYAPIAGASDCPKASEEIATDRPDVTNSSIVVPAGSLQSENGVNLTKEAGATTVDGTNTRLRFGIVDCFEILVDLPTYFAALRNSGKSGFSDVAPAAKWQISPLPGTVDLSAVVGAALPSGATGVAGAGAQPYVQFPWSWQLRDGWNLAGMVTEFFRPADPISQLVTQTTFVIEKKVSEKASLFTEYVGYYPDNSGSRQFINSGGTYRLTPTQQIDFHVALGLNHRTPDFIFGVGYSFRFDQRARGGK